MNEKISELNEKLVKLKKKGMGNLVSFFIEFFVLTTILSSGVNYGSIYNFLIKSIPFLTRELLLSGSIALITLATSIRVVYAKYLNTRMCFLENEVEKEVRQEKKNNYKNKSNDNNYTYQKEFDYHHVDTDLKEKQKIKVLKK